MSGGHKTIKFVDWLAVDIGLVSVESKILGVAMRKITWLKLGFALICLNCVLTLQAASFDCAKALTKMEKLICSDEQLSKMDENLLVAYSKSLQESQNPQLIRKQQREWLADIRTRCNDVTCLQQAYPARIAQLVTSVDATKSAQPFMVDKLGNWSAPTVIGSFSEPQEYTFPKIYFDHQGNATALWEFAEKSRDQYVGFQAFANHFHVSSASWETQKQFMHKQAKGAGYSKIAVDQNRNVTAVWLQEGNSDPSIGRRNDIWSARFDVESNQWSADRLVGSDAGLLGIKTNPRGDTVMLWRSGNRERGGLYFNLYDATTQKWSESAIIIDEKELDLVGEIQFAFDANGNAIMLWLSYEDHRSSVMACRYDVKRRMWSKPVKISEPDAIDPQIAFDGKGNAIAVWGRRPNTVFGYYSVWANHYDVVKGWGKQRLIDISTTASEEELEKQGKEEDLGYVYGNNFYPKIAMDQMGNAIVAWYREFKAGSYPLARRYDVKTKTWQKQILLDNDWGVNSGHPEIAMDKKGNAIIVWPRADRDEAEEGGYAMPSRLAYKRYDAISGWGKNGLVGRNTVRAMVEYPQIDMDINGNAIAVWQQKGDGHSNIMASYFKAP